MTPPPRSRTPSETLPGSCPGAPASLPQVLESTALFRGRPEILIRHNGREYRLRQTRLGKLILTA